MRNGGHVSTRKNVLVHPNVSATGAGVTSSTLDNSFYLHPAGPHLRAGAKVSERVCGNRAAIIRLRYCRDLVQGSLAMRTAIVGAAAALGAVCLVAGLSISADLRGWPSGRTAAVSQVFTATSLGKADFKLSDCTPWTVDLYASLQSSEYAGTATETVVTCRSHSSLIGWFALYSSLVALTLLGTHATRRRLASKTLEGSP